MFPLPVPSPASTSVPTAQNSNGVIILITLLNILVYKLQQLQEAKFTEQTNQLSLSLQKLCRRFSLSDIRWATFNFHDELVIGQGGFGKVYKGIIDFGATTVAIKRLESRSKQGSKEFLTEIEMLSKFQHSHLVSLVGYCDDCHEMILVYEYMPCGTLADHLHKRVRKGDTSSPPLSWEQRLKICIGAARGLDYLHTGTSVQHRVIHRDVKSSNILLDENMAAKISDFGLSKIGPSNQPFSTYVSTHVKGTPGYLDPYYFATHRLTRKSDVYGLGVVLFEALCGRPAVDNSLDEEQRGLAGWAQHCFKEGLLEQIIDPSIKGKILPDSLEAFVRVAIQCLHNAPKHRPTMAEVVVGLELALALQERGTIYTLVETPIINCDQVNVNANSSKLEEQITKYNQGHMDSSMVGGNQGNLRSPMVEVENANDNQENKNCSLEGGVINDPDGGHHDEQSPAKMTFTEKIGLFLFGKARMFSGHSDAKTSRNRRSNNNRIMAPNLKMFTLAELRKATRGFDMMLGEGGYEKVYKGWVHENTYAPSEFGVGMAIAVKRHRPGSMQGFGEWQTKIKFMGNYSHRNLVKLLGYCQEDKELLLVYEYMQNGSLDNHLYTKSSYLDWERRYKIIGGVARGLLYLHEDSGLRIIHRNLKAGNVLLDAEMNPKIAGFGMEKLFDLDETRGNTSRIVGTFGYMAPEYVMHGVFSVKSDVFSFGVLVLEIVSGRKNNYFLNGENEDLASYAWKNWRAGAASNVIDPTLRSSSGSLREMMRCIHIGLLCVQENVADRPTMASVALMLDSFSLTLPLPSEPAFFMISTDSSIDLEMPLRGENNSEAISLELIRHRSPVIPDDFRCPISLELMKDPVIVSTGQTYERSCIQKWLDAGHKTCPKTQQTLLHTALTPDYVLKSLIALWCESNGVELPKKQGNCGNQKSGSTSSDCDRAAIDALLQKLANGNSEQQRAAAGELRLLAKRKADSRVFIAEAGAIPLLVELLSSPDPRTQEHAVTALLNLSINEANKGTILNAGAIPDIVDVLKNGSMEARENAAATLFSLSVVDENKVAIGAAGAIPALIDLLCQGTPRGKKDAATAIFNLSIYQGNKVRAVRAGIVPPLMRLLKDAGGGMVDEALAILAILASHQEGKIAIGQAEPMPVLVEVIRIGSPRNRENAAAVLWSLCAGDVQYLQLARGLGAEEVLKELSETGTDRAKLKAGSVLELLQRVDAIITP